MAKIPDKIKQIAMTHAPLINAVVMASQNKSLLPNLEQELQKAQANGWVDLVDRIRRILAGNRKQKLLIGLDEEDAAIILSILVGIQNPAELPKIQNSNQADFAPQSLAKLLHSAQQNDAQSLMLLKNMIQQMILSPGSMSQLGRILELLLDGVEDVSSIRDKMDEDGKKLVDGLIDEYMKLKLH